MFVLQTINILFTQKLLQKLIINQQYVSRSRNYAKSVVMGMGKLKKGRGAKSGPVQTKIVLPVETDAKKLISFVCGSNIYKEGQDIELKPDSEYPDWLWTIGTEGPPPLESLDPNTKAYWRRVRQLQVSDKNKRKAYK